MLTTAALLALGTQPGEGWPLNYAPEDVGLGPYPRADDPLRVEEDL